MEASTCFRKSRCTILLFDPAPNITTWLSDEHGQNRAVEQMRARLDAWMLATNDPLLRGPVRAPHGAKANNPDGISPQETPTVID
jgi:hypothetical protein